MQGVIKSYDPASGDGIVVTDTDLAEYDLAADALEGSIFRMLRQGQRVVFELDADGLADALLLELVDDGVLARLVGAARLAERHLRRRQLLQLDGDVLEELSPALSWTVSLDVARRRWSRFSASCVRLTAARWASNTGTCSIQCKRNGFKSASKAFDTRSPQMSNVGFCRRYRQPK